MMTGAAKRWSTGTRKKPWICPAWRSSASTRSIPAASSRSATSLAEIGTRGWTLRSWRACRSRHARQDRKVQPRVPISAKLVADLLEAAGIDRLLALDLHAGQIQGFFRVPVDHLFANPIIIDYLGKKELREPVIVAPDAGGVERARAIAKRLSASLAIIDKRREGPNSAVAMHLI